MYDAKSSAFRTVVFSYCKQSIQNSTESGVAVTRCHKTCLLHLRSDRLHQLLFTRSFCSEWSEPYVTWRIKWHVSRPTFVWSFQLCVTNSNKKTTYIHSGIVLLKDALATSIDFARRTKNRNPIAMIVLLTLT